MTGLSSKLHPHRYLPNRASPGNQSSIVIPTEARAASESGEPALSAVEGDLLPWRRETLSTSSLQENDTSLTLADFRFVKNISRR
jgi:hypothetical protein